MSDDAIFFESIGQIARRLRRREISPVELTEALLARIERLNPALAAFIHFGGDSLDCARRAERRLTAKRRGPTHPLLGVPVSVKDLIDVEGFPTSAGSRVFDEGLTPERDAPAVAKLRRAGAIVLGKTNLHEFAYGVTNENAHYGAARNPWRREHVSGGSSGGSAVAVASGLGYGSVGTDTRGSIRIPSACCGVTGLKPTLGRVSTDGVIPLSWTMDHVGPMARSVLDVAVMFQTMASRGPRRDDALRRPVDAFTLGVCDGWLEGAAPEIAEAVGNAIRVFESSGVNVRRVTVEGLEEARHASGAIASSEALSYHRQWIESREEGYDPAVLKRLRNGSSVTGVDVARAMRVRGRMIKEFRRVFGQCDCLIGAVVPAPPPRVGQDFLEVGPERLPVVENFVRYNAPQNVAGVPALALPCGFLRSGLPIGLQLIAAGNRETTLFALGAHFQKVTDWHRGRPPVDG